MQWHHGQQWEAYLSGSHRHYKDAMDMMGEGVGEPGGAGKWINEYYLMNKNPIVLACISSPAKRRHAGSFRPTKLNRCLTFCITKYDWYFVLHLFNKEKRLRRYLKSLYSLRPYHVFLIFFSLKSMNRLDFIICWFSLYLIADRKINKDILLWN